MQELTKRPMAALFYLELLLRTCQLIDERRAAHGELPALALRQIAQRGVESPAGPRKSRHAAAFPPDRCRPVHRASSLPRDAALSRRAAVA